MTICKSIATMFCLIRITDLLISQMLTRSRWWRRRWQVRFTKRIIVQMKGHSTQSVIHWVKTNISLWTRFTLSSLRRKWNDDIGRNIGHSRIRFLWNCPSNRRTCPIQSTPTWNWEGRLNMKQENNDFLSTMIATFVAVAIIAWLLVIMI